MIFGIFLKRKNIKVKCLCWDIYLLMEINSRGWMYFFRECFNWLVFFILVFFKLFLIFLVILLNYGFISLFNVEIRIF